MVIPGSTHDARVGRVFDTRRVILQFQAPTLQELFLVDGLVTLNAAFRVGSRGDSFMVDHGACGLNQDLAARRPDAESQVGILVVCRPVSFVEATQFAE